MLQNECCNQMKQTVIKDNSMIFTAGIPPIFLPDAPRDFPGFGVSSSSSSSWYVHNEYMYNNIFYLSLNKYT